MKLRYHAFVLAILLSLGSTSLFAQGRDVSVPQTCEPSVNQKLQQMIRNHSKKYVENVMACGVAQKTTVNHGGPHGSHHIITVLVQLPEDGAVKIQIAINDSLDGAVSAKRNDPVFAYGQGYITHGAWVAGIHDVHCSTHPSADNGWIVVSGKKTPAACPR